MTVFPTQLTRQAFARRLDAALLTVDASIKDIRLLCLEAERLGISSVIVNPCNVTLAVGYAMSTGVKVIAATSYPVGAYPPELKRFEIEDAFRNGADEVAMLLAMGVFLDGFYEQTAAEMEALVAASDGRPTRLMIEVSALPNPDQKTRLCRMAADAGIDYLVTSTDFAPGNFPGATVNDIKLLAEAAGARIRIIAASYIDNTEQALEMFGAGASRVMTTAPYDVLAGLGG